MPKTAPTEEVAEETTVLPEQTTEETVETSSEEAVAAKTEGAEELGEEGGVEKSDKTEGKVTLTQAELEERIAKAADAAVGKAQSSWTSKLQEKARLEAELKFYREQHEKLSGQRTEKPVEKDEVKELLESEDFQLLPKKVQEQMVRNAEQVREARKEIEGLKKFREETAEQRTRDRVESVVESMKKNVDDFPGFEELIPKIREEASADPDMLNAIINNPQKWLPRIYKAMVAPVAAEVAEKALDKKIKEQVKAKTTTPTTRQMGTKKHATPQEAFEAAWTASGIKGDEVNLD